jgi:hypothetical protein
MIMGFIFGVVLFFGGLVAIAWNFGAEALMLAACVIGGLLVMLLCSDVAEGGQEDDVSPVSAAASVEEVKRRAAEEDAWDVEDDDTKKRLTLASIRRERMAGRSVESVFASTSRPNDWSANMALPVTVTLAPIRAGDEQKSEVSESKADSDTSNTD